MKNNKKRRKRPMMTCVTGAREKNPHTKASGTRGRSAARRRRSVGTGSCRSAGHRRHHRQQGTIKENCFVSCAIGTISRIS
jgi:hypothetical protein